MVLVRPRPALWCWARRWWRCRWWRNRTIPGWRDDTRSSRHRWCQWYCSCRWCWRWRRRSTVHGWRRDVGSLWWCLRQSKCTRLEPHVLLVRIVGGSPVWLPLCVDVPLAVPSQVPAWLSGLLVEDKGGVDPRWSVWSVRSVCSVEWVRPVSWALLRLTRYLWILVQPVISEGVESAKRPVSTWVCHLQILWGFCWVIISDERKWNRAE